MPQAQEPSFVIRILVVGTFALITLFALAACGYHGFILLRDIFSHSETLTFNKGAMYLLGVGLSSGLLVLFMIYEMLGKSISPHLNQIATRLGLAFLALIFIFPQLVGFGVNRYVDGVGYYYCAKKSHRWLHVQTIVFVSDKSECL